MTEAHRHKVFSDSLAEINRCAKCGACSTVCPVYRATGRESLAARGRLHLLSRLPPEQASRAYAEIIAKCLLCGACHDNCPQRINVPALTIQARQQLPCSAGSHPVMKYLAKKTLASPALLSGIAGVMLTIINRLPEESGLRQRLAFAAITARPGQGTPFAFEQIDSGSRERQDKAVAGSCPIVAYFPGCLARHLAPSIAASTAYLVNRFTGGSLTTPDSQTCCGLAAMSAGDLNETKRLAQKNISAFEGSSLPILTSCASCYSHLASYPELFNNDTEWQARALAFASRLLEYSTFLVNTVSAPEILKNTLSATGARCRVFYHDPCHLRFKIKITEAPRKLLQYVPNLELLEMPNGPRCCGQGGLFDLSYHHLAGLIRAEMLNDFITLDAGTVLTTCSGCLLQWQQGLSAINHRARVLHLGIFLAEMVGNMD